VAKVLAKLFVLILILTQVAASCEGTECGNPATCASQTPLNSPESTGGGSTDTYSNDSVGFSADFDSEMDVEEGQEPDLVSAPTDGVFGSTDDLGISTSGLPFTEFTDGETTFTAYYVTLTASQAESGLLVFLRTRFVSREIVSLQGTLTAGYGFDNEEAGATGGDRQEIFFLDGTTLIYIITDLYSDGLFGFSTFVTTFQFN
jgi:hypothetical protein